jgi:hypothetical protein
MLWLPGRTISRPKSVRGINYASRLTRGLLYYWPMGCREGQPDLVRGFRIARYGVDRTVPGTLGDGAYVDSFVGTNTDYLSGSLPANLIPPYSFAVWFKVGHGAIMDGLFFSDQASGEYAGTYINSLTGFQVDAGRFTFVISEGGGESYAQTTVSFPANEWSLGLCMAESHTSRIAFINGVGRATDTNYKYPLLNRIDVGSLWGNYGPVNGQIGPIAVWDRVLSDAEAWELYDIPTRHSMEWAPSTRVWVRVGGAYSLAVDAGSYALSGQAATLKAARLLSAAAGSYALSGSAAGLYTAYKIVAAAGTYAYSGQSAGLTAQRKLAVDAGSYSYSGQSVGLNRGFTLAAAAGSYSLSGQTTTLTVQRLLSAGAGSYGLSGQAVSLLAARKLSVDAGSYSLAGSSVTLSKSGNYTLAVDSGSYALSGTAVGLKAGRLLSAAAGSYSLIGSAVTFNKGFTIAAAAGSYALSGSAAGLRADRRLTTGAGSYSLAGQAAGLSYGRKLTAAAGSYSLTGTAATLKAARRLSAGAGSYVLTGTPLAPAVSGSATVDLSVAAIAELPALPNDGLEPRLLARSVPPDTRYCFLYHRRMFYSMAEPDYPYRLYYSEPDEPESVDPSNYFDTLSKETQTGLGEHADMLVVFCRRAKYGLQGWSSGRDGNPSDMSFRKVDPAVGTICHHSIVQINGKLYYWSLDGLRIWDGASHWVGLKAEAVAAFNANPDQFYTGIAINDTTRHVYVYYYEPADPTLGGAGDELPWFIDRRSRIDTARVSWREDDGTVLQLTGSADGYVRQENDPDDVDDDSDDYLKRFTIVPKHQFFDVPEGGLLYEGKNYDRVWCYMRGQGGTLEVDLYAGDETAYAQAAAPSRSFELTDPIDASSHDGYDYTSMARSVWEVKPQLSGRGLTVSYSMASPPAGTVWYGYTTWWRPGASSRVAKTKAASA